MFFFSVPFRFFFPMTCVPFWHSPKRGNVISAFQSLKKRVSKLKKTTQCEQNGQREKKQSKSWPRQSPQTEYFKEIGCQRNLFSSFSVYMLHDAHFKRTLATITCLNIIINVMHCAQNIYTLSSREHQKPMIDEMPVITTFRNPVYLSLLCLFNGLNNSNLK